MKPISPACRILSTARVGTTLSLEKSDKRCSILYVSAPRLYMVLLLSMLLMLFSDSTSAQSISFSAPIKYGASGSTSTAITSGDFNSDGKADLAVANQNSYNVGILLGNGDGTFSTALSFPAGYSPRAITSGDLNGDGKLDLVVANETGNDLSVLLGNGNGTFLPATNYGPVDRPEHTVIADLNLDGKPDLAVAGFGGRVFVLTGNGDGTFQVPTSYATGLASTSVAVGDFNKDGKPDLAVANQDSGNLSVLINSGAGIFSPAVNYSTAPYPVSISPGDFNRDGNLDLVTANIGNFSNGYINGDGFVSVLLGIGNGTFQAAANYGVGTVPRSVIVGDLNADGLLDLIVANAYSSAVSMLISSGDGTFASAINFSTGDPSTPFSAALGDFNGDGKPDVATANFVDSSASVLINQSAPAIITTQSVTYRVSTTTTKARSSKTTLSKPRK